MSTPTKYFITGGLGFIGLALTRRLLAEATTRRITIYDSGVYPQRASMLPVDPRLCWIRADIRDRPYLLKAISNTRPDSIIHLAAKHFIPDCVADPHETSQVNIGGTLNLLEIISDLKLHPLFVQASSAAVYADHMGAISEDMALGPTDVYGQSKLEAEQLILKNFKNRLDARILRFFNAYGPSDPVPHIIPSIINQLIQRVPIQLGNLDSVRDFIHIKDIAAVIMRSMRTQMETGTVLNVGSGKGTSIRQLTSLIQKFYANQVLDQCSILAPEQPSLLRSNDRKELIADLSRLRQLTEWAPSISLKKGLSDLITRAISSPINESYA